jgi:hypothetical protein
MSLPRWLKVALLISIPCLLALLAYDAVAVFLLRRGEYRVLPAHDFARGLIEDVGLVMVYAITITPRVLPMVSLPLSPTNSEPLSRPARISLIMLGLGIAWYDVLCAFVTRMLPEPPDVTISLVILFVIPVLLAPWYLKWLHTKAS